MKKTTDELIKELESERSIEDYFNKNDNDDMIFEDLYDLIKHYMTIKKLKKSSVIERAQLSKVYGYEILSGRSKKRVSRDRVIQLCFGLMLDKDESQRLLKESGYGPLYPRNTRDSIILYSIMNGRSVIETNETLAGYGLPLLFSVKDDPV